MTGSDQQAGARAPLTDFDEVLDAARVDGAIKSGAAPDPHYQGNSDAAAPAAGTSQAMRGGLKIPSLDPVFYVIVAVAALGLIGSLYALISQNNAYFDREFQQLQREAEALNARLAATEAAGTATRVAAKESTGEATSEATSQTTGKTSGTVEPAVVPDPSGPVSDAEESSVEPAATDAAPDKPVTVVETVDAERTEVAAIDEGTQEQLSITASDSDVEMAALKQQVGSLQEALKAQEALIETLLQQQSQVRATEQTPVKPAPSAQVPSTAESTVKPMADTTSGSAAKMTVKPAVMTAAEVADDKEPAPASVVSIVSESPATMPTVPSTEGNAEVSELVIEAWDAYQAQRYDAALRLYQRAVQFDPYHRDANLGIAASAQFLSDYQLAETHYRHLLSLDPVDTTAYSGLLNLPSTHGGITELELQQHARQQGNPPALLSILGNYFARHNRWSEAQAAFAEAVRADSSNADYLYNHAVSLDNLSRRQEAMDYYARALDASRSGAFSFDPNGAQMRLDALSTES